MTSGRMKGQAFIGLPSEAIALQAITDTNGYQLKGKPIVVVSFLMHTILCVLFLNSSVAICKIGKSHMKDFHINNFISNIVY